MPGKGWEMTSLERLLPSLQGIKLAFVILLAAVPTPLKYKGLGHDNPVQHYCSKALLQKGLLTWKPLSGQASVGYRLSCTLV